MTVQEFIVIYNETFKYIEQKYGAEAVKDLWSALSNRWCTHLRDLISKKGLEGMMEYWGGNDGTLNREKAGFSVSLCDGVFQIQMDKCPSVGELKERGREIYHGELSYCDHCDALYPPIAREYGYEMNTDIDYNESGVCAGICRITAYKKKD